MFLVKQELFSYYECMQTFMQNVYADINILINLVHSDLTARGHS